MNFRNNPRIFSYLFFLLLSTISCQDAENSPPDTPIQIGGLFSLTGAKSDMGIPSSKGAQLAVELINQQGGLLGHQLELLVRDGKSNPERGEKMVSEILANAPATVAFMGFCDSDLAVAAALEAKQEGRVFLTSGATSPLLPTEVPGSLYMACFGDNVQAAAAAEWAFNKLNARTATVVFDSTTTYTNLLQRYFIDRFLSMGGEIAATRSYAPMDITSIGTDLPPADFIFFSAGSANDALLGVRTLREAQWELPILGGDSFDSESIWETHPEMQDVFYTTHAYLGAENTEEQVQSFRLAYHESFGGNEPDAFAALNFDAINLLAQAIKEAGVINPIAVQQALSKISNFSGITGTISFQNGHQIPVKSVTIMEVQEGQRKFRDQFAPSVIPNP